jgi:hypothetical protein
MAHGTAHGTAVGRAVNTELGRVGKYGSQLGGSAGFSLRHTPRPPCEVPDPNSALTS